MEKVKYRISNMEIIERLIQYYETKLIDYIVIKDDDYWALDINKNLIYNNKSVAKISDEITLSFPFFYRFGQDEFLIIDGDAIDENKPNAWIISSCGEVKNRLFVGDGVFKVHIQNEKIIIGYCECVLQMIDSIFQKDRLRIFDRSGNVLIEFAYDYDFGVGFEVEAICKINESEIFIQSYNPTRISKLNIDTYEITNYEPCFEEYAKVLSYKNGFLYAGYIDYEILTEKGFDVKNAQMDFYQFTISDADNTLKHKKYLGRVPYVPPRGAHSLEGGQILLTDTLSSILFTEEFDDINKGKEISYRLVNLSI